MRIIYYKTKQEWKNRRQLLKSNESIIHDDFVDQYGKPTNGQSGRLIIDIHLNKIDPIFQRKKLLTTKLNQQTLTLKELQEFLTL